LGGDIEKVNLHIATLDDAGVLATMNNSAVPDVNRIDDRKARWLIAHARLSASAALDGRAAGVIVVLDDTAALSSEYFQWFTARYRNFLYIDRVIVAAWARRQGVATRLYREVDRLANEHHLAVASEVYCDPPNAPSLAFHAKMGYMEIGQQLSLAEGKTVAKLIKYREKAEQIGAAPLAARPTPPRPV
jgi:predicted GNAT superfamily acetyltransferase